MTMIGKILVFANLTLSLIFATWAVSVFTQRVDFSDKKGKDPTDERGWGRVAKLKEELTSWNGDGKQGRRPWAETRWLSSLGQLRAAEKLRLDNQAWYADQLAALANGNDAKGAAVPNPVKRVAYLGGVLELEKGLPKLMTVNDKGGQPLKPRTGLIQQQADLDTQIKKIQEEIAGLRKQADELTGKIEVVFREIARAAQARQGSVEEQRYLERVLYNVQVEGELLLDRQQELEVRLKELQSTRATSQNR